MGIYLVTGGAGFIGSHFITHLLKTYADAQVVSVDALTYAGNLDNVAEVAHDPRYRFYHADIRDTTALTEVFAETRPDFVINFAAQTHVDRSIVHPADFVSANVMGTVTLMDAAVNVWLHNEGAGGGDDFGRHRFLQMSTDEVYGVLPLDRPDLRFAESTPLDPRNPYAASKAAADLMVQSYTRTFGFPALIVRSCNAYGTHQYPEKLIPLMVARAKSHRPLPVYGDGRNVRDWLHVEDLCRAIDLVLHRGHVGEAYNVGARCERSNIQLVHQITEICERILDDRTIGSLITFVEDRKAHDARYAIDASKIQRELGWQPSVAFDEGLEQTVRWYLQHETAEPEPLSR